MVSKASPHSLELTEDTRVVRFYDTLENNLGIKHKLAKYLKGSLCLGSDENFFIKYFPNEALLRKILRKI